MDEIMTNDKAPYSWHEDAKVPVEWYQKDIENGWPEDGILLEASKFERYWSRGKGEKARRTTKGWKQTWVNWINKVTDIPVATMHTPTQKQPIYSALGASGNVQKHTAPTQRTSSGLWYETVEPFNKMRPEDARFLRWYPWNKTTRRFHIPMRLEGGWYWKAWEAIQWNKGIHKALNYSFGENRSKFYDESWEDGTPDFWFVPDEYLEWPIKFNGFSGKNQSPEYDYAPSFSRSHTPEDSRVVIRRYKNLSHSYALGTIAEKQDYFDELERRCA